jgi:hypothetical protein
LGNVLVNGWTDRIRWPLTWLGRGGACTSVCLRQSGMHGACCLLYTALLPASVLLTNSNGPRLSSRLLCCFFLTFCEDCTLWRIGRPAFSRTRRAISVLVQRQDCIELKFCDNSSLPVSAWGAPSTRVKDSGKRAAAQAPKATLVPATVSEKAGQTCRLSQPTPRIGLLCSAPISLVLVFNFAALPPRLWGHEDHAHSAGHGYSL